MTVAKWMYELYEDEITSRIDNGLLTVDDVITILEETVNNMRKMDGHQLSTFYDLAHQGAERLLGTTITSSKFEYDLNQFFQSQTGCVECLNGFKIHNVTNSCALCESNCVQCNEFQCLSC